MSSEEDQLHDTLAEQEALAMRLFEQQFIRVGGRKPADPTWDEIDESERDEYRSAALDAKPLLDQLRAQLTATRSGGFRQGGQVGRNIYCGPHPEDEIAVAVGPPNEAAAWARQIVLALALATGGAL